MYLLDTNAISEMRKIKRGTGNAASALQHGLVLVTRNGADFANTGVKLFNPFAA